MDTHTCSLAVAHTQASAERTEGLIYMDYILSKLKVPSLVTGQIHGCQYYY